MPLVSTGPNMASTYVKDLGMGGLYEWELEATAGAGDEPHCC